MKTEQAITILTLQLVEGGEARVTVNGAIPRSGWSAVLASVAVAVAKHCETRDGHCEFVDENGNTQTVGLHLLAWGALSNAAALVLESPEVAAKAREVRHE